MEIKAVFFDLDGTLFNSTRAVSNSTRQAIADLHRNGIYVGIATGRGPAFCLPLMEELSLDFAVVYNGQYIFTPKEVLYEQALDKKLVRKVIRYAQQHAREISLGTAHGVGGSGLLRFGETRLATMLAGILPSGTSGIAKNSFKHVVRRLAPKNNYLKLLREPIYQMMMVATARETEGIAAEFPELSITRSNSYSIDLIPKDSGKLSGIQWLGEHCGFDISETVCFGDSDNDLSMLEAAGYGVAMGNASPAIKAVADYVTDGNNQDGIAKALDFYGLVQYIPGKAFVSKDRNFNQVKEFHKKMDGRTQEYPQAFPAEEAGHRADFKVEEIVEFLYAASEKDPETFAKLVEQLHQDVDKAAQKVQSKKHDEDKLTGQVDALIDLLYLTYGSLVLSGIDPYEIFQAVHASNMAKIFPDGKAHFDPETHKILKPKNWEKFAPEKKIKRELDRQKRVAKKKWPNLDVED